jgi:hypothetical protein
VSHWCSSVCFPGCPAVIFWLRDTPARPLLFHSALLAPLSTVTMDEQTILVCVCLFVCYLFWWTAAVTMMTSLPSVGKPPSPGASTPATSDGSAAKVEVEAACVWDSCCCHRVLDHPGSRQVWSSSSFSAAQRAKTKKTPAVSLDWSCTMHEALPRAISKRTLLPIARPAAL